MPSSLKALLRTVNADKNTSEYPATNLEPSIATSCHVTPLLPPLSSTQSKPHSSTITDKR